MPFFLLIPAVVAITEVVQAAAVVTTAVVAAKVAVDTTHAVVETVSNLTQDSSSTSSSSSTSTVTTCFEKKAIYDWWLRSEITYNERQELLRNGYSDKSGCFTREELEDILDRICFQKAPGKPTEKDGFKPKKGWNGKTVKAPNSKRRGYLDENGNVWVPTGQGTGNHEPHWDVEFPRPDSSGRTYKNVYPKGNVRY